jgi:hypothetical protein
MTPISCGDVTAMLELFDAELEWTYLGPSVADPQPQVCHGRGELEAALQGQAERGLTSRLEEVITNGDRGRGRRAYSGDRCLPDAAGDLWP